ncbi:MAG: hypothetical protein K9I94_03770 [Bacteroidales bacterium]|nr:hypothetical protein [Bacteroidales bacterium]
METRIIISIVALLLGLLYFLYPKVINYYFRRPKLIVNSKISAFQSFIRHSQKNEPNGIFNEPEINNIYKMEWMITLNIFNRTEEPAYNIVLMQHKDAVFLPIKKNIKEGRVLTKHGETNISYEYSKIIESPQMNVKMHRKTMPKEFEGLSILCQYENKYGKLFYSEYDIQTDKTKFPKMKCKNLKQWQQYN